MPTYAEPLFRITTALQVAMLELMEEDVKISADQSPALKAMDNANKELVKFIQKVRKDYR